MWNFNGLVLQEFRLATELLTTELLVTVTLAILYCRACGLATELLTTELLVTVTLAILY